MSRPKRERLETIANIPNPDAKVLDPDANLKGAFGEKSPPTPEVPSTFTRQAFWAWQSERQKV